MCTFNTLLLPTLVPIDAVNVIAHETLGQRFITQGNGSIENAVAPNARSYIKDKHCDCGMGLAERRDVGTRPPSDRELRKLRAAGWGEAKIERWLAQQITNQQKRDEERDHQHQASLLQAGHWAAFVRRILEDKLAPWVGLFTHTYHGSVHTERIRIRAVRRFVSATAEQVDMIEEDTPFVFAGEDPDRG